MAWGNGLLLIVLKNDEPFMGEKLNFEGFPIAEMVLIDSKQNEELTRILVKVSIMEQLWPWQTVTIMTYEKPSKLDLTKWFYLQLFRIRFTKNTVIIVPFSCS